jgi:hypothetical protein
MLDGEITWLDQNQDQPTEEEINAEIIRISEIPVTPEPDWRGFFEAMKKTTVFSTLREQARVSIEANAIATELYANLQAAALGLPDLTLIQQSVNDLLPFISEQHIAEIAFGTQTFNIPLSLGG